MEINVDSLSYVESLYDLYLKDPNAVSVEWKDYFSHIEPKIKPLKKDNKIEELINAYRLLGHLHANIDPLGIRVFLPVPELMLSYYHFKKEEVDSVVTQFKKMYCGTIAYEFMHIPDSAERLWIQERIEGMTIASALSVPVKKHILECLTKAEGLEKYLGNKYPGAKRFSLEGTDSLLVGLDHIVQLSGKMGFQEVVIGMAHRGRLNVLVNLLGKVPSQLFDEFENKHDVHLESGDVKYHQGFSSNVVTEGGAVHLSLAFNPSHLEIVTPVVNGSVRARQMDLDNHATDKVLCVALHGDAAFAAQGVVMESLNMSKTHGYAIGGTLHIIVNNQIGFTTSDPLDARSTLYCSDIGKMMGIPIFHVNANDPEAVYRIITLSLEYRHVFKKDVIIDLVGYRRHGHNEADEPSVTQPLMYQLIRKLPTCLQLYTQQLISEKVITAVDAEGLLKEYQGSLDSRETPIVRNLVHSHHIDRPIRDWKVYYTKEHQDWRTHVETGVSPDVLKALGNQLDNLPQDLSLHPRVKKIIENRQQMTQGVLPLDWGYAEIMAYATLLNEGTVVRISGQDSGRGTFFHRHAVLHNQDTQKNDYIPLESIHKTKFCVIDSLLSESAVLGFEYGFSSTIPDSLVVWEAQFGDFANNAQVVIDQFISSGEQKWGRLCGLTLFLPHGYEGMGPEHSSARLERFLQLCAEYNIQVCVPTTPAQMFHLLRRQVLRLMRKPLIVLTPKSLLRHALAVSSLEDLSTGVFQPVLPELDNIDNTVSHTVKRMILCSGKIYYELLEKRRADKRMDVVIIRMEQLYPFPDLEFKKILGQYEQIEHVIWCQEEPQNQGAWFHIQHYLPACLKTGQTIEYIGRAAAAAPAVGYHHLHQEQQASVVTRALG